MSFIEYLVAGAFLVPVIIYLVVRFGTAAYFNSKSQYERQKRNGRP